MKGPGNRLFFIPVNRGKVRAGLYCPGAAFTIQIDVAVFLRQFGTDLWTFSGISSIIHVYGA